MADFKFKSVLPSEDIKFVEWKIKANSKISNGSVLFLYEYKNFKDGTLKTENFKWNMYQTTIIKLSNWKPGDKIKNDDTMFTFENCTHPIECNEMCGVCGEDLRKRDELIPKKIMKYNPVKEYQEKLPISHADPNIKVSRKEADDIGKKDLINLVRNKKLVLLVDLDHTLIHTTNENVSNQLKDVYHYELSQRNVWYHTKFRPGCKKFLEKMSKLYELQICTFGERKYAHKIADFMDHDRRYFHNRILSRNEIFNPISKTDNLKALFPRGDLMVCIIDDREDVWNYARNLICVQPYVYFKNTGDINDPKLINMTSNRKRKTASPSNETENSNSQFGDKPGSLTTVDSSEDRIIDLNEDSNSDNNSNLEETSQKTSEVISKKEGENLNEVEEEDTINDPDDPDRYLIHLEEILKKVHDEYYKIYEARLKSRQSSQIEDNDYIRGNRVNEADLPDVKKVLPLIKSRVLENVVISFSGVVPTGYDLKKQRCYLMATSLGAKVNEELVLPTPDDIEKINDLVATNSKKYEYNYDEETNSSSSGADFKSSNESINDTNIKSKTLDLEANKNLIESNKSKRFTTHLVAAKYGTCKVHEALKSKPPIKVVTPEWLINSNFKWTKCDEDQFKLTKDYDYKNCVFHEEYQKYSATNPSSISTGSFIIEDSKTKTLNSKRNTTDLKTKREEENLGTSKDFSFSGIARTNENDSYSFKKSWIKNESSQSLSSFQSKTKKQKSNEDEIDLKSDEDEDSLITGLNDDMLENMDKEVDEELGDSEEDEDENENDEEEDVDNNNTGDDEEDDRENNWNTNGKGKKLNEESSDFNLSDDDGNGDESNGERSKKRFSQEKLKTNQTSFTSSSNSLSSSNNSLNSIDDELALALERDFTEKK